MRTHTSMLMLMMTMRYLLCMQATSASRAAVELQQGGLVHSAAAGTAARAGPAATAPATQPVQSTFEVHGTRPAPPATTATQTTVAANTGPAASTPAAHGQQHQLAVHSVAAGSSAELGMPAAQQGMPIVADASTTQVRSLVLPIILKPYTHSRHTCKLHLQHASMELKANVLGQSAYQHHELHELAAC
jgi:hypothetical protein